MKSSQSRDRTCVSCIGGQILYHWATGEVQVLLLTYLLYFFTYKVCSWTPLLSQGPGLENVRDTFEFCSFHSTFCLSETCCCFLCFYLFSCFWLCWVLLLCMGFLQLLWAAAALHCLAWASHCGGFSCFRAQASVIAAHGLSNCSLWALEHWLSSCPLA